MRLELVDKVKTKLGKGSRAVCGGVSVQLLAVLSLVGRVTCAVRLRQTQYETFLRQGFTSLDFVLILITFILRHYILLLLQKFSLAPSEFQENVTAK